MARLIAQRNRYMRLLYIAVRFALAPVNMDPVEHSHMCTECLAILTVLNLRLPVPYRPRLFRTTYDFMTLCGFVGRWAKWKMQIS